MPVAPVTPYPGSLGDAMLEDVARGLAPPNESVVIGADVADGTYGPRDWWGTAPDRIVSMSWSSRATPAAKAAFERFARNGRTCIYVRDRYSLDRLLRDVPAATVSATLTADLAFLAAEGRVSSAMKLAAICCTYKRPKILAEAIESFLRQDYSAAKRELIVLDDAGQYAGQHGDGWRIVSLPTRFRTLGEKRNASAALVSPDVDAYCVWDDDDIYLPWHMSAAAAALDEADYAIPSAVLIDKRDRLEQKASQGLFHGAWSFRREAFEKVCGYPFIQSGQDQGLLKRFKAANLRRADPIKFEARPSYVYRWFTAHTQHISAMGADGYQRLGRQPLPAGTAITPGWEQDWPRLLGEGLG